MCRFFFSLTVSRSVSYLPSLVIVVVVFLTGSVWGQELLWTRTYGGSGDEGGYGVCQTSDGGYIVVGPTTSFGSGVQIYLVKTDARGDTLWTKTYGGAGWDHGNSVRQTSDGGYIVAGWTDSFGLGVQVYLIKTDPNGDTLWTKTYGGSDIDDAISVQQTSDGGYIVAGSTNSYGAGKEDVYLIKTDSTGQVEWTRTYGGSQDEAAYWVEQTSDGGYIMTGYTTSFGIPEYSVYLIKTDPKGDTLWTRVYYRQETWRNRGFCCQETWDGGYVVSGFSSHGIYLPCYYYLIKTDAEGDTLWTRTYGGFFLAWAFSVRQTYDGGYIVAGFIEREETGYDNDIYIVKTDPEGDTLWTRIFGGSGGDVAEDVQQTSDRSYIVVGATTQSLRAADVYLLKISGFSDTGIRGDVNGDGKVTISDVVYLINYLFRDGPPPQPLTSGDTNCDGTVDLGDVIWLINYLFPG